MENTTKESKPVVLSIPGILCLELGTPTPKGSVHTGKVPVKYDAPSGG
jgi:hypothetical protein